jgi:hypothetical protein
MVKTCFAVNIQMLGYKRVAGFRFFVFGRLLNIWELIFIFIVQIYKGFGLMILLY